MFASQDIVQIFFPQKLQSYELDAFLAEGWFRSCTSMYRSQIICMEEDVFSVVNIRLPLQNYQLKKSLRKIHNKVDKAFSTIIRPAFLDMEKEALYQQHKNKFKGFIFSDLQTYLYANNPNKDIFSTYEVAVYDSQHNLVAVSFFDMGKNSTASIIGLYSQDYPSYSLGLYTMICEALYSQELGMSYYYPGYIFHISSLFDYKLRLGDYEYFDWKENWLPYHDVSQHTWTADVIKSKIETLKKALKQAEISFHQYYYPLFSFGYLDAFQEFSFVREALLIQVFPTKRAEGKKEEKYFLAYLPEKQSYTFFTADIFVLADLLGIPPSDYHQKKDLYYTDPLCYTTQIAEIQSIEALIEKVGDVV